MKRTYTAEINELCRFWDETYPVSLPGGAVYYGDRKLQVGWASTALQKFTERIKISIKGGPATRNSAPEILRAIANAVKFGNSALIIDRATGLVRVSPVKTSWSEVDSWGNSTYVEELPGGALIVGHESELWLQPADSDSEPVELDAFFVSIFFRADDEHPFGQSRLTPASRSLIRSKSTNRMRREITADQGSYPQVFINGLWEDADPGIGEAAARVIGGTNRLAGLPKDPDTDAKLDIEQLTQVSPGPLLSHDSALARDFASIQNISPAEVGEPTAMTKEAIDALKESLLLEVEAFEVQIRREVEAFLLELAAVWDESDPDFFFMDPAVVTRAAAMDAATKASSVWPGYKYSEAAAREARLGEAVISELFDEGEVVVTDAQELLLTAGANSELLLGE